MLRQQAFIENRKLLKGGLHCHTTRSDGNGSPEEVIRLHAENGYDFLALTDHRIYNYKNYAENTEITIVPGMEIDAPFENNDRGFRCFHTVCLGADDETNGFSQDEQFFTEKIENQFDFQPYLDRIHAKNNLTFYCHPEWSSTPAKYFDKLEGEFAMEVWNSGCVIECDMDVNAPYWDEMLGLGHKIWGVAVDDGHKMYQHCKGWVMVNSENNVKSILSALKDGAFYSSCGPVIRDFYVEDDVAHIEMEPCSLVTFNADRHPTKLVRAERGASIVQANLKLHDSYDYIRATVVDADGRRAWTNPIFLNK